jgi:hypothetical protein
VLAPDINKSTSAHPMLKIDRLNVGVSQMRTTVRVPLNKAVLVGGLTKSPGTPGELYLITEITAGN